MTALVRCIIEHIHSQRAGPPPVWARLDKINMLTPSRVRLIRYGLSGALAGALSSLSFALIHQWLISSIWFFISRLNRSKSL
jgi:hypothetical protein